MWGRAVLTDAPLQCVVWFGILLPLCQMRSYTNRWAVKVSGGLDVADEIAEKYGFLNMGQIGNLENYYHFLHRGTMKRATVASRGNHSLIATETKVDWVQQQMVRRRMKRDDGSSLGRGHSRAAQPSQTLSPHFNDPKWDSMWYIHCDQNCLTDMNVRAAWGRGFTGRGVVVSILDDGIERLHPDLKQNYDARASYDINGNDPDPTPRYDATNENKHGTRCAGVVAAAANNSLCTVGIAHNARIGGVRMLDGDMTDMVEAQSLSLRQQYIDIYSSSWGPDDDGRTVDSPGPLARLALENGIRRGRKGRGSIFVWASGNGGRNQDHCSCDGYTNSIYTISVGSTTQSGRKPWYLEECSSTLTTTYSSGESHRTGVVTTDLRQRCTEEHSGTSASAPMAAGIIALTLEANPSLTWRDVQHIIVKTSRPGHLSAPDWQTNGAGHDVSHLYGFGLMDAEAMVKEAEGWKQVPPQHVCVENPLQNTKLISPEQVLRSVYKSSGCSSQPLQRVAYLEHVIVRITVMHPHRGDLSVFLTSPAGTKSQLLANRPNDHSTEGFQRWDFMSTHCWGERPTGEWILEVRDTPSPRRNIRLLGRLVEWSLVLHGTAPPPYAAPRHEQPRSAEQSADVAGTEEYSGPCDPECSDDGCEGPGPQQCVSCLHFFLKFKNSTRACVAACPAGFWGDRKRCKRCYPSCETCQGSRGDQCTTCKPGHHLLEETGSCVTSCGDGFYLHHEDNVCRSCSPNCLKCTSSSICAECTDGMSLLGNRCQRSCGAGSFYSEHQGGCELCHPACATCAAAGMESCTRCAEDHLMEGWRCVPSCSPGFYAAQQSSGGTEPQDICKRCDTSCRACVGPGADSCTECDDGHTLRDGECVLTTDCQDGEYQDENGKCHSCHASCQKCRGPQREDCVTCPSSHWLEDGSCVARCPEGKYQLNGQCHLCDHTCAQCVDASPANCTSCNTDKFGLDRYLYQGGCVDACPAAHYHSALNTCEACAEHCGLCASLTHCLKCNASYYLNHGVCTPLECGEGEVEDPEYDDCMPCEEGCRKCVLYNPKHCLSCIDGFYKFEEGCYKICPAKTYSIEEDMSCVPCERDCVSCDQEECHWCEADLFLSEGKCVRECPDGFYGDEDSQECESCHLDCGTCSGPEEDECDSCHEGLQLLESGECMPEQDLCPAKTYLTDDGDCESCHVSCDSCWGNLRSQCSSCVKGRYLSAEQTCVARCPAGSFGSKASGMCEGCPKGCAQCQDGQRCLRCQPGRKTPLYLQDGLCVPKCTRGHVVGQVCRSCAEGCASCDRNATHCLTCEEPLLLHKHQCVEACPPAHTSQEGECVRCPQTCLECSELGLCAVCEESTYLHEGQCVHMCPDGFYEDTKQGVCGRCHPDCELCDGPDPDNCDACTDPDAVLRDGACVSICPAHTYRDNLSGECRACDGTCLTCSGPHDTSCTSCNEGLRTDAHGRCATPTTCPAHHYANQDGECHLCHKYCKQCSGPDKHQCLSCNQNHFLLNDTCMNECPVGTFAGETQRCEPCHPNCQACVGRHSHECLSCRTHLFREGKECVETCHASHYGDVESGACERCDSSCGECLGAGPEGCVSCREGLLYIRKQGRCVPTCPTNYYHDNLHATCEPCHASCKTCSGKGDEACDSCHEGHILSGGVCEPLCIMGEYHVPEVDGYTCEPCDDSCVGCRGPGPHNCTACPEQGILTSEGRCLPCCKSQDSDKESKAAVQQECCNCTESRGECILRTNFAFHNHEEEEEPTGNLGLFITTSVLLLLGLAAVVILIKRSFSKRPTPDAAVARGYEKLGHGAGRHGGSHRSGTTSSSTSYGGQASSSSSGHFHADQLVDLSDRPSARDDDDEDDDEDIVYMGQDGTVYRKFRYGQLNEDQEDELEYDDESYTFR